jgi:hypothetical protein
LDSIRGDLKRDLARTRPKRPFQGLLQGDRRNLRSSRTAMLGQHCPNILLDRTERNNLESFRLRDSGIQAPLGNLSARTPGQRFALWAAHLMEGKWSASDRRASRSHGTPIPNSNPPDSLSAYSTTCLGKLRGARGGATGTGGREGPGWTRMSCHHGAVVYATANRGAEAREGLSLREESVAQGDQDENPR